MLGRNNSNLISASVAFTRDQLRRLILVPAISCSVLATSVVSGVAQVACKPILSFRNVQEVYPTIPPIAPRTWKASIVADTRFCATTSGNFEIDFVRIKEYSADLQFTERLRWSEGQFEVSMELNIDESILEYRFGFVAPCVCRDFPKVH